QRRPAAPVRPRRASRARAGACRRARRPGRSPRPAPSLPWLDDRLGHPHRSTVREPGASPGRSRRCEGRRFPVDVPLAIRGALGRRRGREPRVRRPVALPSTEPLAEGGFVLRRFLVIVAAVGVLSLVLAAGSISAAAVPHRIVSLSPTATESLFAIGAGSQVIAADDQSDYPSQAPRTKLSGFTPNVEAIASYKPDLVVISNDDGLTDALGKLGIKTLLEPAPATVAQAYDEIRQIGAATGHAAAATKVVRGMEKQLTALIRSVPKKSRHLKVFHELS